MLIVLSGFLTSLSLIAAIGAQNLFVLRQGLMRSHILWLCLFCSVSDAILILTGVSGVGAAVSLSSDVGKVVAVTASIFLFVYGAMRLRAALVGDYDSQMKVGSTSLKRTLALAAMFTWANPHVYLDTVLLIGAVSTTFGESGRWLFGFGATLGSFFFFFTLGYGAKYLAPLVNSQSAWRALDTTFAVLMWSIAYLLLFRV